jgi:capsular exopolysaccharide synthesis family protein
MSRVDEALRRASSLDASNVHAPIAVEPTAVVVDESALNRYAGERPPVVRSPARERSPIVSVGHPRLERATAFHASLEGKAVVSRETSTVSIEQYRRLAAALHAMQSERGLKTLMVTSAMPNEGKTLTVTNLALTLTESYARRVLLVDADFRRPRIHELFGLMNVAGLAECLRSTEASLKMIEVSPTLSVLPAGQGGNSANALLSSDRMRAVIADAALRFDWVLIDTPPVGVLSDAHLVARVTDGVLFVIAAGSTPYTLVQRSLAEIGADRIVGTVLNRVEARTFTAHDYYGRYDTLGHA